MADDLEEYARKINSKISEEDRWEVYFNLSNNRVEQQFAGFLPYYPKPRTQDYTKGFMYRHFFVRYDGQIIETNNKEASRKKSSITRGLYTYILLKWRLKDSIVVPAGLSITSPTTAQVNDYYISQACNALPIKIKQGFKNYFSDLEEFKLFTK